MAPIGPGRREPQRGVLHAADVGKRGASARQSSDQQRDVADHADGAEHQLESGASRG